MTRDLQTSFLFLMSALLLSGCGPKPDRLQVIARTVSPDGEHEAIQARDMSGGATVGPSDEVYVMKHGAPIGLNNRVVSLERVCSIDVRWLGSDTLAVGYRSKRPQDDRLFRKSVTVKVRSRWLGRDAANGC